MEILCSAFITRKRKWISFVKNLFILMEYICKYIVFICFICIIYYYILLY